jgi:hypothetical protein
MKAADEPKAKKSRLRRSTERKAQFPSWLKVGTFLTGWTIALTLLGYGHECGFLEPFDLYPEQLQLTPLDFLQRSYHAILFFIEVSNRVNEGFSWDLMRDVWLGVGVKVLSLAAGSAVLTYLTTAEPRRRFELVLSAFRNSSVSTWFASRARLRNVVTRIKRLPTPKRLVGYGAPLAFLVFPFAVLFVSMSILWLAISAFTLPAVVIPVLPAAAARKLAYASVIDPARCRSPGEPGKRHIEGARCVRVIRQGCEVARGRYIEQAANRVWLLTKRPWNIHSAPLDGNVTEDVDNELAPAGTRMCQVAEVTTDRHDRIRGRLVQ